MMDKLVELLRVCSYIYELLEPSATRREKLTDVSLISVSRSVRELYIL